MIDSYREHIHSSRLTPRKLFPVSFPRENLSAPTLVQQKLIHFADGIAKNSHRNKQRRADNVRAKRAKSTTTMEWKGPFILDIDPRPPFFSLLRRQDNATVIATVCSMKRHNIWTIPLTRLLVRSPARARARAPRPPAGYAPPLLDKYAPSQHSQYRIQLRLIVFSLPGNGGERKTDDSPCVGVLACIYARHYARPHVVDLRITAARKVCVMRIKCDKISREICDSASPKAIIENSFQRWLVPFRFLQLFKRITSCALLSKFFSNNKLPAWMILFYCLRNDTNQSCAQV